MKVNLIVFFFFFFFLIRKLIFCFSGTGSQPYHAYWLFWYRGVNLIASSASGTGKSTLCVLQVRDTGPDPGYVKKGGGRVADITRK